MNVRLKVDTRATGPAADIPVIVGAGMVGDRVSIVFSNIEGDLASCYPKSADKPKGARGTTTPKGPDKWSS